MTLGEKSCVYMAFRESYTHNDSYNEISREINRMTLERRRIDSHSFEGPSSIDDGDAPPPPEKRVGGKMTRAVLAAPALPTAEENEGEEEEEDEEDEAEGWKWVILARRAEKKRKAREYRRKAYEEVLRSDAKNSAFVTATLKSQFEKEADKRDPQERLDDAFDQHLVNNWSPGPTMNVFGSYR